MHHKKGELQTIFLTNIDTKILDIIFRNGIQQGVKRIISHDQIGFLPCLQGWLNIQKPISVIHHINKKKNNIISTDAKKHFTNSNTVHDLKNNNN